MASTGGGMCVMLIECFWPFCLKFEGKERAILFKPRHFYNKNGNGTDEHVILKIMKINSYKVVLQQSGRILF